MDIGDSLDNLTIIKRNNINNTFVCKCTCGNIVTYKQDNFRRRKDRHTFFACESCKKEFQRTHAEKIGIKYYKLTPIEYLQNGYYRCKCDCGNECVIHTSNLRSNDKRRSKTSCGCDVVHYNKNENYFETIDSEAKAYILGFIASDGCVSNDILKITLKSEDTDILEKISKELNYNGPIKIQDVTTKLPQGTICNSSTCTLTICSGKIVNDLKKYGIVPKKSTHLKINFELIPDKYVRHFLRGFYDGDGTCNITHTTRIGYNISIGSSHEMIEEILKIYNNNFPQLHGYIKEKSKTFKTLSYGSKEAYTLISDFLYKDSTIYLERKYQRYLKNLKLLKLINSVKDLNCKKKSVFYNSIDFTTGEFKTINCND